MGKSDSHALRVRFPRGMLPEGGLGPGRRPLADGFTVGEKLFVALRREQQCGYSVQHFWLGSSARAHKGRESASPTATV